MLPQTTHNHLREDYGPSTNKEKNLYERCIAIPYFANERPSEQSEFALSLETINYTMQSFYAQKLSPEMIF